MLAFEKTRKKRGFERIERICW